MKREEGRGRIDETRSNVEKTSFHLVSLSSVMFRGTSWDLGVNRLSWLPGRQPLGVGT